MDSWVFLPITFELYLENISMNYYIIPSAFFMALFLTFVFAALSGRGPWRTLFIFFFIIFLAGWAGQLWITPFGPVVLGVSWMPLIFVSVIFSFLIIALSNPEKNPAGNDAVSSGAEAVLTLGMFFWFLILILISSIVIGYYKTPSISEGMK